MVTPFGMGISDHRWGIGGFVEYLLCPDVCHYNLLHADDRHEILM